MKRLFLSLAFLALAVPAFAADETIYRVDQQTISAITYNTVSSSTTNAIPSGYRAVRLLCTTACYVSFGVSNATAAIATAATGVYLPAVTPYVFKVNPGEHIQVIQVSAGGTLTVHPLTQ